LLAYSASICPSNPWIKVAKALDRFHAAMERVLRERDLTCEELAEALMVERAADASDD